MTGIVPVRIGRLEVVGPMKAIGIGPKSLLDPIRIDPLTPVIPSRTKDPSRLPLPGRPVSRLSPRSNKGKRNGNDSNPLHRR